MSELPKAFLDNMQALLGPDYEAYLKSFSEKRLSGLRVNTLKISVQDFLKISPFPLKPVPWTENGFYVDEGLKPGKHPYYYAGLYYLQEPSAMTPAAVLPVMPGDRVLDVCAAPGGKSTELAAKLKGTGTLLCNDISYSRAQALLKNLELFGVKNALVTAEDPKKLETVFPEYFDKILIDAPCSGEGMFRKEPAVIRSWVEHGNQYFVNLQRSIIDSCLHMLRPGGMLVYSTCTFSPLEDEDAVLYMKEKCPGLEILDIPNRYSGFSGGRPDQASKPDPDLEKCIRIFPHEVAGEGHFVALLRKPGDQDTLSLSKRRNDLQTGTVSGVSDETREFLRALPKGLQKGCFELKNQWLSARALSDVSLKGLRIMRNGLLYGEEKKNRFEPSQALSMAIAPGEYENRLDLQLSDPRVLKYLKGETLEIGGEAVKDGWCLVTLEGYPLGFGKAGRGILKNKYLPGWRYN